TDRNPEALDLLRHSAGHLMAEAVGELFDGVQFDIGPSTDEGFYYDFDMEHRLGPEDLERIETKMHELSAAKQPFVREEMSADEATRRMEAAGQRYKVERIRDAAADSDVISMYTTGSFTDVCRGPHVPDTGRLKVFKLLSVAGSYFRGDARNKMLQRIYGTAFFTKDDLTKHLDLLAEAEKRDHRRLGRELELFSTSPDIGQGLILWHPKLGMVRHLIESFWRDEHLKRGYEIVYTPHIASERIYRTSGHLEKYADMMYSPMDIDGTPYYVKPMNCPAHIAMYGVRPRSYRELPLRWCELGTVYRYEPAGTLHGMMRVRGFTQDDSHIFCTPEQLTDEVLGVLDLAAFMMEAFGYTCSYYLATRPEKYLGTPEEWEHATACLKEALERRGLAYEIDEGGGVFYAPKIDIKLADSLGREWQGPTIQVDLNLPNRFDVNYVGPDNHPHKAVMIHRTVLGSMERFIGGLIEHVGGAFPVWLAPEQVRVLPITEAQEDYAREVHGRLRSESVRCGLDDRSETIGAKIRDATLEKVPYMLVVGAREAQSRQVAVRARTGGDLGVSSLEDFIARVKDDVASRRSSTPAKEGSG
ncbi:MAG TPA: threonine--tRNA ligase, partial [Planctomycetota bacterium]|nr:threonine--tRNA ligase [Planctomycetota bacterium]